MTITGGNGVKAKRAKLLETFKQRHGFLPILGNQPSEATLTLLVEMHANRSIEFFPLARVSNFSDGRDIKVEPQRIRGTPFLLEANGSGITRKNTDFLASAEVFGHAVRVLMHGYALVSMSDEPGNEWRGLESALKHVSTVENYTRANAKAGSSMLPRIMEAESSVRSEWTKLGQSDPGVSLSAIIDIVAQRHAIWPLISEFTSHNKVKGGKGKSTQRQQPWYPNKGEL